MKFETRPGFQLGRDEPATNGTELQLSSFRLRAASQPSSPFAPFASISSNIMRNVGIPGDDAKSRKENHTAFAFPTELCHRATPCPDLAGLGVRAKRILGIKNINIYALGIYVDSAAVKKNLAARYASGSEETLSQDQKLFNDVIDAPFEKSLRLVISYGSLQRSQFLDALNERMEPRLKKSGDMAAMEEFKRQFDDVTLHRGTELVFVQEGTKLTTKIDGKQRGVITSAALCRSLFDIYLGSDPVAPDAKANFGKSLAAVLKQ